MADSLPGVEVLAEPEPGGIPATIKVSLALVPEPAQVVIAVQLDFQGAVVEVGLIEDGADGFRGHLGFFGILFLIFFDVPLNALNEFIQGKGRPPLQLETAVVVGIVVRKVLA